jgi:uncharacterized protein (DUF4415 family)
MRIVQKKEGGAVYDNTIKNEVKIIGARISMNVADLSRKGGSGWNE